MRGKFKRFQWVSDLEHPIEETALKIIEYNKEMTEQRPDKGQTAEIITDQLIREICAYAHKNIFEKIQEATGETDKKEARDKIKRAIELLEDAESYLE